MARRNKKKGDPENHERWLLTYADMITLLLIFFIILYSMSKIDVAKYTQLAQSLSMQFKKVNTVIPHGKTGTNDQGEGTKGTLPNKTEDKNISQMNQSEQEKKLENDIKQKEQELQNLKQKIEQYINDNKLETQVSVKNTDRGIAITLNDLFLFDSGKADLKAASFPILAKLATLFPDLKTKISFEGHTDNQPLSTGSIYKDNQGLSAARSLSVMRYFDHVPNLDPNLLVGSYYGDSKPVAPNDTPENRQKNRRVEIIVLRDTPQIDASLPAK
jgi:chemotaxis protein MotB